MISFQNEGQTPLHIACTEGDENTVKFFSTVKANPNIYDKVRIDLLLPYIKISTTKSM